MSDHSSLLRKLPPIAYFVLAFALGFALDATTIWSPAWAFSNRITLTLGIVLILPAIYFGFGGMTLFMANRQPLMPGERSTELMTRGPFRLSRNPMYLGLALLHAGLGLALLLPITLVLLVAPLAIMQFAIIPDEEARMQQLFGQTYAAYRQRVRRWI